MAPSLNYLQEVTYQIFKNTGLKIDITIQKHGFYPKGGANVKCVFFPPIGNVKPINLTELGNLDEIKGEIIATDHLKSRNIGERIKKSIQHHIKKNLRFNQFNVIGIKKVRTRWSIMCSVYNLMRIYNIGLQ